MEGIVAQIQAAGVVGAGGAGFPTHVKAAGKAEFVLVNGAECEPLLRVDQQLLASQTERVLRGLAAIMQATGASRGVVALKAKYREALAALEREKPREIEVFLLPDFYPAGDEQVIVYEVTGRLVPEGGIPLQVGCVVVNVETLVNVARALDGVPVTEKWLTVTGAVAKPLTVRVPLGISFAEVLALAGGATVEPCVVLEGGPMMGKVVTDLATPVTKTTKGLIVLPPDHPALKFKARSLEAILRQAAAACCQCSLCTELCPRHLLGHHLEPHRVMRAVSHGATADTTGITQALLCSECGVCDVFACPMDLSPRRVNMALKAEFARQGLKNPHQERDLAADPQRGGRRVPIKRLVARLGLTPYNVPAPLATLAVNPRRVVLPLKQHVGKPATPRVKPGQRVERGELVATMAEGALGANLHASISGIVRAISPAIIIEAAAGAGKKVELR